MLNKHRLDPSTIFLNHTQADEFKHTVVKGSFATVLSQGASVGLSITSAVVLARLLTPDDFGLIGMVTVFINFLYIFKDIGLSHATIQKDVISKAQISTLFWINGLISLSLGVIMFVASPLVSQFYKREELTAVMAVLAFTFVVEGFAIQHNALLRRHLKFTAVAIIDVVSRLSHLIASIIMALMGFSYWSLVGGHVVRSLVLLSLTYYSCPWMPGGMKKGAGVRNMIKFGGQITTGHILSYLATNLDQILIGRIAGAAPLGLYNKAYHLLMQPLSQIRLPLTNLSLPILSSLKNDTERYKSYFDKLLDISISLALPISVYCFLDSEFLIRLILGPQWMEAVPVFRILAIGGVFVSASFLPSIALLSYGYSKRYMQLLIATSVITSISFVIGIFFGITGVAAAYTIASFLVLIPMFIFSFKGTPIEFKTVFMTILWPLLSSLVASVISYLLIRSFSEDKFFHHILIALSFFIVYTGLTLARRKTREAIISIWKSIIYKKKKDE